MFVQTFINGDVILHNVKPPIHYIVFATPHKNEIPSPKTGSFGCLFCCTAAVFAKGLKFIVDKRNRVL